MNLNILSRSFRHGTLGLLGVEHTESSIRAYFIFRTKRADVNLECFIYDTYEEVSRTNVSMMQGDDSAYVTFSIRLMSEVYNPRKLLKSIVDDLAKVESVSEEQARAYKEVEEQDAWDKSPEGQAYLQQQLQYETLVKERQLHLLRNRGIE